MRMNARRRWRFWFVLYLQEMFGQILAQLTKKHSKIKQHHRSLAHPYGKWGTTEASQLEEGQGPPPPHPLTTLQASLPMSAISFCTFSNLICCICCIIGVFEWNHYNNNSCCCCSNLYEVDHWTLLRASVCWAHDSRAWTCAQFTH